MHLKYNRNLINDEDQEVESHLRRRHDAARRMSQIVLDSAAAADLSLGVPNISGGVAGASSTASGAPTPRRGRHASIASKFGFNET